MPTATKKIEAWFDYPDDPDKGRVLFCLLTEQDMAEIKELAQVNRNYIDKRTGGYETEIITDISKDRREAALRATKDWENFYTPDRKPMECTRDNIISWSCDGGFMKFLYDCQIELRRVEAEQKEAARKNS